MILIIFTKYLYIRTLIEVTKGGSEHRRGLTPKSSRWHTQIQCWKGRQIARRFLIGRKPCTPPLSTLITSSCIPRARAYSRASTMWHTLQSIFRWRRRIAVFARPPSSNSSIRLFGITSRGDWLMARFQPTSRTKISCHFLLTVRQSPRL
jgi:hypothetical protein